MPRLSSPVKRRPRSSRRCFFCKVTIFTSRAEGPGDMTAHTQAKEEEEEEEKGEGGGGDTALGMKSMGQIQHDYKIQQGTQCNQLHLGKGAQTPRKGISQGRRDPGVARLTRGTVPASHCPKGCKERPERADQACDEGGLACERPAPSDVDHGELPERAAFLGNLFQLARRYRDRDLRR